MSDNTNHLAKKCVKDAGPCLALCLAGAAVGLFAHMTQSAVKSHNGPADRLQSVGGACR